MGFIMREPDIWYTNYYLAELPGMRRGKQMGREMIH